jgi:hypothetical protein
MIPDENHCQFLIVEDHLMILIDFDRDNGIPQSVWDYRGAS